MTEMPPKDDEFELALRQWEPQRAPSDFAERVTSRLFEERPSTLRMSRSRLLVPLVLAALFLSAGAFAAWQVWSPRLISRAGEAAPQEKVSESPGVRVIVHHAHQDAQAEPEKQRGSVVSSRPAKKRDSLEKGEEPSASDPPEPKPPNKLHLPDCECGTSAIVCSCTD